MFARIGAYGVRKRSAAVLVLTTGVDYGQVDPSRTELRMESVEYALKVSKSTCEVRTGAYEVRT